MRALSRCRIPILTFALTYLISVSAGVVMVHLGNDFALSTRDNIVANARDNDPASIAY
jgi:hypothetical protein